MSYHLVDELKGVGGSRRLIKSFEYFQDAKEWIIKHTKDLYSFIPDLPSEKLPDFRKCRSFADLNRELHRNEYLSWRLTLIEAKDTGRNKRLIIHNMQHKTWVTIAPYGKRRGTMYTSNGVHGAFVQTLTKDEIKVIRRARLSRVLRTTQHAILVEWLSDKGTIVVWIPKRQLAK